MNKEFATPKKISIFTRQKLKIQNAKNKGNQAFSFRNGAHSL